MQILITGGTGFIGSPLCERLVANDHRLTVLTRQTLASSNQCHYVSDLDVLAVSEPFDAIINLAGASLAQHRWTPAYKREIFASRLETTRALIDLIQRLDKPPAILLSASAVGYYGHHGDEALDESGEPEPGFSHDLCRQWEELALTASERDVRVCLMRLGVVLDRDGGAFTQMARPFHFGIANYLGNGRQWLSWVHRRDVLRAIEFLLERDDLSGPFNITAVNAVTSRGFSDSMKRRLRTVFTVPVPAVLMRVMIGPMADELLLKGQRVIPSALQQAGFAFEFPDLDTALKDIL